MSVLPPALAKAAATTPSLLDPTFGASGVVTLATPSDPAWATAVARQADGKLVVAGPGHVFGSAEDAVVARLMPTGQLDASFGTGGYFVLPGAPDDRWPTGIAVQPSGKIIVLVGVRAGNQGSSWLQVFRLDTTGHLDASFGNGGSVLTKAGLNLTSLAGLALYPDGRVLVANDQRDLTRPESDSRMFVERFTVDGAPDGGFGTAGVAEADFSVAGETRDDTALAVAPRSDGGVVIGGVSLVSKGSTQEAAFAAFTASGAPDANFGTGGKALPAFPAGLDPWVSVKSVAFQAGGKVIAAGTTSIGNVEQLLVARINTDGTLDTTFGSGGVVTVASADGQTAVVDGAGRIIVGGQKFRKLPDLAGDPLAVRLLPDGAIDTSFGGGPVVSPIGSDSGRLFGLTLQPDGHVVAAGEAGDRFTVLRYASSTAVSAFGLNPVGELGTGTTTDAHSPVTAAGLAGAVSVSAGAYHGLAVKGDGSLWSFGWNALGQLGDGTTTERPSPVPVTVGAPVIASAAGVFHSLALGNDGIVRAFGWNGVGQLGNGTTTDAHAPVALGNLTDVVGVAAGAYHSLAVRADGTVWAWGWNILGQLGDGTTTDRHSPVQVNGLTNVVAVAAGAYSSLALKSDGTVWFWGWNGAGQAGDGTTTNHLTPVQVPGLTGVIAIASGYYHSLALKSDGTVRAWGWNASGELGDGTTALRLSPVAVSGLTNVTSISGGAFHSLATRSDGTVVAWGWNGVGQLGTGTTIDSLLALTVPGITGATAVSAGLAQSLVVHGA